MHGYEERNGAIKQNVGTRGCPMEVMGELVGRKTYV